MASDTDIQQAKATLIRLNNEAQELQQHYDKICARLSEENLKHINKLIRYNENKVDSPDYVMQEPPAVSAAPHARRRRMTI